MILGWVLSLAPVDKGCVYFYGQKGSSTGGAEKEETVLHSPLIHAAHPQAGYLLNGNNFWFWSSSAISQSRLRNSSAWRGCVCVYRSVSHATCNYCPHACSVLDWEGTLMKIRQGSRPSGAYKFTTEHQENRSRQREVPNKWCMQQTLNLKAHIWSRALQQKHFFFFNRESSDFAFLLFVSFWKGVNPNTHERCLILHHSAY